MGMGMTATAIEGERDVGAGDILDVDHLVLVHLYVDNEVKDRRPSRATGTIQIRV